MTHMIHNRLAFNIRCASYRVVIFPSTCYPILAMFFLLVWLPVASARPQKTVVDVASKSQLFVDQELVGSTAGFLEEDFFSDGS